MNFLIQLGIYIGSMILQEWLAPRQKGPARGNPKLPTVSQSRKVPLAVGTTKIEGPNVLDATAFQTSKIKIKTGTFIRKSQTIGHKYFQSLDVAIAWGAGELYEVWGDDKKAWAGSESTETAISITSANLFGSHKDPGLGGMSGTPLFIPGSPAGSVNATMEALTGRDQPGYPGVARLVFIDGNIIYDDSGDGAVEQATAKGFYFGNSENFRAIKFVYGYYPNPLSHAINHKIGNGTSPITHYSANPAYVLYELNKNTQWGLGIQGTVDAGAIASMAATLHTEGAGISRVWYDASAADIEQEILLLIDGIRYRDPETGNVIYKLIRDDWTASPLPELTDNEIGGMSIDLGSLSSTPTELSVEYIDVAGGFASTKLKTVNSAAQQAMGRSSHVSQTHWGCSTSAQAQRIARREIKKITRPRRQGQLWCDRTAWDWSPGDTIKLQHTLSGITSMVVRISEIDKGSIIDGRVTIRWIEEIFEYGNAVFDAPTISKTDHKASPTDITNYLSVELPWFLLDPAAESPTKLALFAESETGQTTSVEVQLNTGGTWFDDSENGASTPGLIDVTASRSATSIVITGVVDVDSSYSESDVLTNGYNLLLVEATAGQEWLAFRSATYDSGTGKTTLNNVLRGLLDTHPQDLIAGDQFWLWTDKASLAAQVATSGSVSFRMLDKVSGSLLAEGDATTRTHTIEDRYNLPAPPGYVRINSGFFPASVTGPASLTWAHRSSTEQADELIAWADSADQTLPGGVTYTVTWYDTSASPWTVLQNTTGLTGTSDSYSEPASPATQRDMAVAIKSVSGSDSRDVFVHEFEFTHE